jgi:hypothetical protein
MAREPHRLLTDKFVYQYHRYSKGFFAEIFDT